MRRNRGEKILSTCGQESPRMGIQEEELAADGPRWTPMRVAWRKKGMVRNTRLRPLYNAVDAMSEAHKHIRDLLIGGLHRSRVWCDEVPALRGAANTERAPEPPDLLCSL